MAECKNIEKNKDICNCTYTCPRKGLCCECLHYHREKGQLPACYFDEAAEKTYDRSIEHFISLNQ